MSDVDAILRDVGLDAVESKPLAPMRFPRIVDENDGKLWMRCQVDGAEREAEITIGQAWGMVFSLLGWLAKAARR